MRRTLPLLLSSLLALAILPARAVTYDRVLAGPALAAMYPSGLEYDAKNDRIVVADTGRNRILFYSTAGAKLPGTFGSHGTGPGEFDTPRDVAVDGQGRIYVADAANNRIQQFTQAGVYLRSYGTKIYTPIGVTWDAANDQLLVASTSNHRIVKLSGTLTLIDERVVGGSSDPWSLSIENPRDVTRGPDGLLWISAYKDHQIRAYDDTVTPWTLEVTLGLGVPASPPTAENLNFPYNVDFSPSGDLAYVSDTGHSTVAVWDVSGGTPVWVGRAGTKCADSPCPDPVPGNPQGVIDDLRRVTVLPNGRIVTADFWGNGLQVFDDDDPTFTPVLDIAGKSAKARGFAEAFGVDVAPNGRIYGMDRLNQQVDVYAPDRSFLGTFGDRGTQADEFSWPEAVAAGPGGIVWTADTRGDRIQRWTQAAIAGSENPTVVSGFAYPEDLDVAEDDGSVWVADTDADRIAYYDGGSVTTFVGGLDGPQGVAVNDRFVFVADTGANRIRKYDRATGALLKSVGGVAAPEGVAVAPGGQVFVADTGRGRVLRFTARLVLRERVATPRLTLPHTLAVNGAGNRLYVADTFANRVLIYRV
ncbi:MAG TPA: NHL repeat-containing protein [Actinomycetota bacterium]